MTRRLISTPATEAQITPVSPSSASTMASSTSNPQADILELQRQIQHLTAMHERSELRSDVQSGRRTTAPPMNHPLMTYQQQLAQLEAQNQARLAQRQAAQAQTSQGQQAIPMNTLYDEWARNTPWEQAQQAQAQQMAQAQREAQQQARTAGLYANLPIRGNTTGASASPFAAQVDPFSSSSLATSGLTAFGGEEQGNTEPEAPEKYSKPFCDFLTENPTIFHAVKYFEGKLAKAGYEKLSERESWTTKVKAGGKYYLTRNGSGLIAFSVGTDYKSGDGVAMIAGHIDALTAKLKPISKKNNKSGYVQLGVAHYGGALNETWWDRDLGVGGRVLVKRGDGKVESLVVKIDHPIAKIPTLAPHFGVGIMGTNNPETQAVPIIGVDNSDLSSAETTTFSEPLLSDSFAATQPPALLKAIAEAAGVAAKDIINWELELFDTQPAQLIGINKDILSGGRIDDKLCSWAAIEALLCAPQAKKHIDIVALFDDEEIGSLLRQGARGNFLPSTIERISETFQGENSSRDALQRTYANSWLVSADVSHAVNPNFQEKYLQYHSPRLNVGVVVSADSNGHMTTDAVSTAMMQRVAELSGSELQVFQIRNDSRSGGTVGPMLSSAMGCRAIDVGIPQLSMHSVRASTGALDPGLGVRLFHGVFKHYEQMSGEFDF